MLSIDSTYEFTEFELELHYYMTILYLKTQLYSNSYIYMSSYKQKNVINIINININSPFKEKKYL